MKVGRRGRTAAATLLALCGMASVTRTAEAAAITVWAYGDGNTTRALMQMKKLSTDGSGLVTGVTVVPKTDPAPLETTGVKVWDRSEPGSGPIEFGANVGIFTRIWNDLGQNPTRWPDVIHIGYNASAGSYNACNQTGVFDATVLAWADAEAVAISDGGDLARYFQIKVLLSKGPGVPIAGNAVSQCVGVAAGWVTYALQHTYAPPAAYPYWVDYSGTTSSMGLPVLEAHKLYPSLTYQWDSTHPNPFYRDYVHTSTMCSVFQYTGCLTTGVESLSGSYRTAQTLARAYKAFQ
jgi:hypothetical protein